MGKGSCQVSKTKGRGEGVSHIRVDRVRSEKPYRVLHFALLLRVYVKMAEWHMPVATVFPNTEAFPPLPSPPPQKKTLNKEKRKKRWSFGFWLAFYIHDLVDINPESLPFQLWRMASSTHKKRWEREEEVEPVPPISVAIIPLYLSAFWQQPGWRLLFY